VRSPVTSTDRSLNRLAMASLDPDDGLSRRATGAGVLVMGKGDAGMQLLNPQALEPPDSP
jgi:hypothetical protein